ncbi:RNA polymerase sigma factor SigM [Prescottella subtropica]|uniref:RNA polymerase sigma factor SigM n=1 Tax=Prescottella subtropica TaxID=2545757 RepID=UPI0010F9AEDA|nr:RNA polymerase sigma factor SigM [Prescottella subtropica]
MRIFRGVAKADLSDADLLAAHASGDKDAFAELLSRHYEHLWLVARRTSYTVEDAEDALQEALTSAHRKAGTYRADAAVRSWLHTIVVNACLDRHRRNRARPAVSLSTDDSIDPHDERDRISERETSLLVDRALQQLPAEQRAAIVAVDLEGYSVAEAARRLGVPEGTIKSRCARARLKLASHLEYLRDAGNRS